MLNVTFYDEIVFIVIGLVLGSFSTAIAYRNVSGQSWIFTKEVEFARSKCPKCNETLQHIDLIPFFSYVFMLGRCRYCQNKISLIYVLTEVISAFISLFLYLLLGSSWLLLVLLCVQPFLLAQCVQSLYYKEKHR